MTASSIVTGSFQFLILRSSSSRPETGRLSLLLAHIGLDPTSGLGRRDDIQPIGFGFLLLGRQNLDDIAVVQHLAQRDIAVIDLTPDASHSQTGMDIESEIEHRRALAELAQVAVGSENEHLARRELRIELSASDCVCVVSMISRSFENHCSVPRPPPLTPL